MKRFWLLSLVLVLCSFSSESKTLKKNILKDQVVTQEIKLKPGFSTMIEVPEKISSYILADPKIIECLKIHPNNKITCKPLTDDLYSTNLIILTESNEFNLILKIVNESQVINFKYVFQGQKAKLSNKTDKKKNNQTIFFNDLKTLLNDFKYQKCDDEVQNDFLKFKCDEIIIVGLSRYLKFKLTGKSKTPFSILNFDHKIQTLGGFTGLKVKSTQSHPITYLLPYKILSFESELKGVLKLPNIKLKDNQRLSVSIYTDIGKNADLLNIRLD